MNGGFVKQGYVNISELLDRAIVALHGEWAIERPVAIPGVAMTDDKGNMTGRAWTLGGSEFNYEEICAFTTPAREALKDALKTATLIAWTQDGDRIRKDSWTGEDSWFFERTLTTDGVIVPEYPLKGGQQVLIEEQAASDWLREFLMSQDEATEPAADPSSLDAFKEPYWSLYECLAWIMARDADIVNQVYRGTGFDSLDITILCATAPKEDGKTDVSVDSQPAIDDLLKAARLGTIQVLGAKNGRGDLEPVPATAFHAARFNTDRRDVSLEPRGHDQDRTIWGRLTFNRNEIMRVWAKPDSVSIAPYRRTIDAPQERLDWSYLDVLAWIYTRDFQWVERLTEGYDQDHERSMFAERYHIQKTCNGLNDPPFPPLALDAGTTACDIDRLIIKAARSGIIKVRGAKTRFGKREEIPATDFHENEVRMIEHLGDIVLSPIDVICSDNDSWGRLAFNRDEILAHWQGTQDTATEPAAQKPKARKGKFAGAKDDVFALLHWWSKQDKQNGTNKLGEHTAGTLSKVMLTGDKLTLEDDIKKQLKQNTVEGWIRDWAEQNNVPLKKTARAKIGQ